MVNLITGIYWIDHGLIPRREPKEASEEQSHGEASEQDSQDGGSNCPDELAGVWGSFVGTVRARVNLLSRRR